MELFNNKENGLEKISSGGQMSGKAVLTEEESANLGGGYEIVSDPIYKLTDKESRALSSGGYKLKKTNSGNYRIMDENGKMASPSEIATICKVVNRTSVGKRGRTFWDFLMGD